MIKLFQGDTRGGLADYDKALQYDPADAYSWNNRGQAKMRLGDKAGAIADFRKALEINPGLGTARDSLKRLGARNRPQVISVDGALQRIVRFRRLSDDIRRRGGRVWVGYLKAVIAAADVCLFSRGGLQCRALVSSASIVRGRLVRHAAWCADRGMPWFPFSSHDVMDFERSTMILNTFVVGMLVFGLAQLEYVALQRWEEVGEIALGLWLIASPFIFGYSGDDMLRAWHIALGAIVVLLGALQLWQDWRLSDQELANHPQ